MRRERFCIALLCLVVAMGMAEDCFSAQEEKKKVTTYKVPTSGKILDVTYQAEFDEWWIKCREKDAVVVYTLDQRTGKWGSVRFVPGKPSDRALAKPTPAKKESKESKADKQAETTLDLKAIPQEPKEEAPSEKAKTPARPEPPKKLEKMAPPSQDAQKQWWNPLNVLEKGKDLFKKPGSKEDDKRTKPNE